MPIPRPDYQPQTNTKKFEVSHGIILKPHRPGLATNQWVCSFPLLGNGFCRYLDFRRGHHLARLNFKKIMLSR